MCSRGVDRRLYKFKVLDILPPSKCSRAKRFDIQCPHCKDVFYGLTISEIRDLVYDNNTEKWCSSRLKAIYTAMISRCYNSDSISYKYYGKRGITVCNEWLNDPMAFHNWAINNGYDNYMTIHRIDNDCNYCPENCTWIPLSDNVRLMASSYMIPYKGSKYSIIQMENMLGLYRHSLYNHYVQHGEAALLEAVQFLSNNRHYTWSQYRRMFGYANNKISVHSGEDPNLHIKIKYARFRPKSSKNRSCSFTRVSYKHKRLTLQEWSTFLGVDVKYLIDVYNIYGENAVKSIIADYYFDGKIVKLIGQNKDNTRRKPKRKKIFITINGVKHTLSEWSSIIGVKFINLRKYKSTYGKKYVKKYITARLPCNVSKNKNLVIGLGNLKVNFI